MRSIVATFLLALAAAAAVGLASYQMRQGNFDVIFGSPATPVGENLYTGFLPQDVARIEIRSGKLEGAFEHEGRHWQALTPWNDRMDPAATAAIIQFTLGLRVEDFIPVDTVSLNECGLDEKAVLMRLIDKKGEVLAHYKIGRKSSWKAKVEIDQEAQAGNVMDGQKHKIVDTVYVHPQDKARRDHVYICAGDITPLFQDGLKLLRDRRPLYFNPLNLQTISIQSQQGEITLSHEHPRQSWRIIKPLELHTDRAAMNSLIQGLVMLRATNISERSEVTLPANGAAKNTIKINLKRFGEQASTTLEIFQPESLEETTLKAVVSDRPGTVFELPAKPTSGLISLADLPLDVNSLRDPTVTRLNIAALKSILISPSTGQPILISKESSSDWMATINSRSFKANETNLYKLLQTVTKDKVSGFESDAATDFSQWGLDRPILTLRFLAINNESLELRFGMNVRGEYFVNRTGTPTVMKVDRLFVDSIAVLPHQWKHELVWSINRVNLKQIVIKRAEENPLILSYDYFNESWEAERDRQNLTPQLSETRANYMISQLEGIRAERWLSANDIDALSALSQPSLTFITQEQVLDANGAVTETNIHNLILAPAPKHFGYYYAMAKGESNPFLISNMLYQTLAADLLNK